LIGLGATSLAGAFYFFYFFNALGYVCGGPLPCQVLVSRWFDKTRGRCMGIAYLGIGVGGAIVPLLSAWLDGARRLAPLAAAAGRPDRAHRAAARVFRAEDPDDARLSLATNAVATTRPT
jgi:hypothetical protein